ncbi:hypothetical protein FS842_006565 [Serendipita sp. 407]|nr:hypothetical protein FRC20_004218 [Serendipita sp. 405]KAG9053983.1 hypothetical protein FS842_006565 [Serendipita sp. 407]
MSTNLSKKQKKATAFKHRKSKGYEEPQDVPLLDDPEADDGPGLVDIPLSHSPSGKEEKRDSTPNNKRKRDFNLTLDEDSSSRKRQKVSEHEAKNTEKPSGEKRHAAPKYILFVGNLSYKTSAEAIAEHFSACDPPPTIRRLTNRSKSGNTGREKFKGCAFLEFSNATGLQTALRLHHSVLDGRKINVELSAGGGGKGEARIKKLKEKNAKLDKHRIRPTSEQYKGNTERDSTVENGPEGKTRHSETSGGTFKPTQKATWSVPRKGEKEGRGGQKHRSPTKVNKNRPREGVGRKWTMTGPNAIPVG